MSCTDTQATRTDIATTEGPAAPIVYGIFGVPAVGTDVAVCSRYGRAQPFGVVHCMLYLDCQRDADA